MFYIHYFQDSDIGIDQHIFNLYFNFPGELEFYLFLFLGLFLNRSPVFKSSPTHLICLIVIKRKIINNVQLNKKYKIQGACKKRKLLNIGYWTSCVCIVQYRNKNNLTCSQLNVLVYFSIYCNNGIWYFPTVACCRTSIQRYLYYIA